MKVRKIMEKVKGNRTTDGAGVHLTRVLSRGTVANFDPFLMLDSFDSTNPEDYIKGFPTHPHRGIETVTYLISGEIDHEDSLGNKGVIGDHQCQWMTAGSGILHQEMPQRSERMLGLQLWVNLPQKDKMVAPNYFDIQAKDIPVVEEEGSIVRVIAGKYKDTVGVKPKYVDAIMLDVDLAKDGKFSLEVKSENTVFIFLMTGKAKIQGEVIDTKIAALLGNGQLCEVEAADEGVRFIFCEAAPLKEPVAWGGPIVMNTQEELDLAFEEIRQGTFIK